MGRPLKRKNPLAMIREARKADELDSHVPPKQNNSSRRTARRDSQNSTTRATESDVAAVAAASLWNPWRGGHRRLLVLITILAVLVAGGLFWGIPAQRLQQAQLSIAERRLEDSKFILDQLEKWRGETAASILIRARIARLQGDGMKMHQLLMQATSAGAATTDVQFESWLMQMQSEARLPFGFTLPAMLNLRPHDNAEVLYAWIWGCAQTQQLREGELTANHWTTQAPDDARAWFSRGRIEEMLGRTTEATVAFEKASKLQPNWVEARLAYADQLRATSQSMEAVNEYRTILKHLPRMPQAWRGLTQALVAAGELVAAESALRDWLAFQPKSYDAATQLADILIQQGNPSAAIELLTPLEANLSKDSQLALLLYRANLASQQTEIGDRWLAVYREGEAAEKKYTEALVAAKAKPLDAATAKAIAEIIFPYRFNEAIPWLQTAVAKDPMDAASYERLATAFDHHGRMEEANSYRKAAALIRARAHSSAPPLPPRIP